MKVALGIVIGFIAGALWLGLSGGVAGAFTGFIVMLAWRSREQARAQAGRRQDAAAPPAPFAQPSEPVVSVEQRLAAIEARLAALERTRAAPVDEPAGQAPREAPPAAAPDDASVALPEPARVPVRDTGAPSADPPGAPEGFVRTPEGTLEPVAAVGRALAPPPAAAPPSLPAQPDRLWGWFTGGNALTRIGVVALIFGVGFLLKYLAEIVVVPIEAKLAGVALGGGILVLLGARLARTRPGYGVSLEGAGAGILYLTTFAALRLYALLPPGAALALLAAIAALTVWLAIREDSQPLAALAIAGGFLAPFLVATSPGRPELLFGYFLVLNAAILALAWVRAWRALNVLGFVFTFVLGSLWGERYYEPGHFAVVEPFLAAFFLFYLAIAILYARRGSLETRAPVDAILVFGVPLVALSLQAAMLRDTPHAIAWSAWVMALVYFVLWLVLRLRGEPAFTLLARAFLAIALILVTVAIPLGADARWTSAWWALEASAAYWIGCRQRQALVRAFALLLQLAAGLAFLGSGIEASGPVFANAVYLGSALVAVAGLVTAWLADRHRDAVTGHERTLSPILMLWAIAWWYGGGALEIRRVVPQANEGNAILAFAVTSVFVALLLRRALRWPRLAWFGAGLLPIMIAVAFADWHLARTTLTAYGWIVWPIAWAVHWWLLRAADALREDPPGAIASALGHAHAASAIALVAWSAWELSEWVGRAFPPATVWVACAAAWPAAIYLGCTRRMGGASSWPFADYAQAYTASAGTAVAALLAVWFLIVNVVSPGDAAPLPYVPLANPLDVTLIAALAALFAWSQATLHQSGRAVYGWFGAALFLLVNAIVFRAVHQWGGVRWDFGALLASKILQAALTLTWTATALPLMLVATRRAIRPLWMIGAALLAAVVVKLFVADLSALSGLPRVVAFLGVGALLLLIGYLAPLPPVRDTTR